MFRRAVIIGVCLFATGCASVDANGKRQATVGDLALGAAGLFMGAMVAGDPNRHVSTVRIGGEVHTVTTRVSADGRKSSIRVD